MAEADPIVPANAPVRRRWPWPVRFTGGVLLTLVLAFLVALWGIDTSPGHRFLADRIAALPIKTGLRIRIGRIDGSIWHRATLRDLRLYDTRGLFFEAPEVELEWRPAAWLRNRLDIERLGSDLVILHRMPVLRKTRENGPILPGFDIHLGALRVGAVRLGAGIAGEQRTARLTAHADIVGRRALIDLSALVAGGGDRLRVHLDAAPDDDRFDLAGRLTAPAGSLTGKLVGTRRPIVASVGGRGRWTRWDGMFAASLAGRRVADLAVQVRRGDYRLIGTLAPAPFLAGKLQRLSAPMIYVNGGATLADRQLDTRLELRSAALALNAKGRLDLGASAFGDFAIDANLLRPAALFPNMSGRAIRLQTVLDGPFRTAAFRYRATAPRFAFDDTGFEVATASGAGRFGGSLVKVPIRFTARRVTGIGDVAGGILADLSVQGVLDVTAKALTGTRLALASDKLRGTLDLRVDLVTGDYGVGLTGGLARYLIPGVGIVDVTSQLAAVPGPGGHGTIVKGRGRAIVRRFDNAFLRSLAGGLPTIDTALVRTPDGVMHFSGLTLTGPAIRLAGTGLRRRDGTFQFDGGGTQASYGPLTLKLDGQIDRPKLDIMLAHPVDALGLSTVHLLLDPDPAGFAFRAAGGSTLGPFAGNGHIDLPSGAPALIRVAALAVSGTRAAGTLRSDPAGFTGSLDVAGGGLGGRLLFRPAGTLQRIETHLRATGATIATATPLTVRKGMLDAVLLLDPAGTAIEATATAQGLRRGPLSIARLAGNAVLKGGRGTVRASLAGARGRAFAIQTVTAIAPDRVAVIGQGTLDRQPIRLEAPALFTRDGEGWRLATSALDYGGGVARVGGRFGGGTAGTELDAALERMPLAVLDIGFPTLGLGGEATGRLTWRLPAGAVVPSARMDMRVRGLTRSGLVLSSRPIDVGVAGLLSPAGVAARAVMASGGRVIGRAQGRIAPFAAHGDMVARLRAAPLLAQLRYDGPADTLWRLTGIEGIDLSGPAAIGADVTGSVAAPVIRGSLRTSAARLESAVTGTVIENLAAQGRFGGSRLQIDRFTGTTPKGGTLDGRATFDFAARHGLGMDIRLDTNAAVMLARDDIGATVTGPLTIRSDGAGGTISGDVQLVAGRYRLGRAAAASIPRLDVTEINRPADEADEPAPRIPWALDLHAKARNRLAVSGLGLDSEWKADLAIRGTVDNPAITGRADLVRGGYEFAGRRFELDRGMIRFAGEAPPDPVLDIVAKADLQGLDASIRVSGTGLRPEIGFQSTPALPEDELLSRLLFGSSITSLSAPEALQLAAAVASLREGSNTSLNPINTLRRAAGLDRLRILPADPTTGQGTAVAAGKYLTRRTYVEVISDGAGYSATRVEFQITRWLSVLSTISTIGRQSANVRVSKDY